jgi:drug/metabolite transporter (DMT)-like permease
MNTNLSINLFIVIGLIVIGLVIVLYSQFKKEKIKPNYRLFFILGMTWVPLGVVFYKTTRNIGFLIMGVIFLIIGLINKDKWGETVIVNPQKRKLLIGLILTGLLVLITFLLKYFK